MTDPSENAPIDDPLPEFLIEHARRFAAEGRAPSVPRRAATVLLLREPFEVYAMRRTTGMVFGGMYAFPGGSVDPRDERPDLTWSGSDSEQWAVRLGVPAAQARGVVCAAVREVFEECGVLLAGPADADPTEPALVGDTSGADWEAARLALVARELSLADLLRERGLAIRADLLTPWARWLTPEFEPRRFDTWFFLARLPAGQSPRDLGGEAEHTLWLDPAQAGGLPMLPPTRLTLRALAACASVSAAMAASRDARTVLMPSITFDARGRARLLMPSAD